MQHNRRKANEVNVVDKDCEACSGGYASPARGANAAGPGRRADPGTFAAFAASNRPKRASETHAGQVSPEHDGTDCRQPIIRAQRLEHDPEKWKRFSEKIMLHQKSSCEHDPEKWKRFSEKIMLHQKSSCEHDPEKWKRFSGKIMLHQKSSCARSCVPGTRRRGEALPRRCHARHRPTCAIAPARRAPRAPALPGTKPARE